MYIRITAVPALSDIISIDITMSEIAVIVNRWPFVYLTTDIMHRFGKLYFRYGTMGSAKTALLLTQAYNLEERGRDLMCLKPVIDTREERNVIRSRIGISRECGWIYPDTDLFEYLLSYYEKKGKNPEWV